MDKQKQDSVNTYSMENGMLSSPQIAYCQKHFKIIKNYKESCLKPATYEMRIGGPVLSWLNGKKIEFELAKSTNYNADQRTSLELKPNSLTFVTTIEKFNLPKDIIARFNLKSKWVHKGLLLGTGPIVDPEFCGQLLIPLHNFSAKSIIIQFDEKFIVVEFTKTLNPADKHLNNKGFGYVKNPSPNFNFTEYRNKTAPANSSVLERFDKYSDEIKNYKDNLKEMSDSHKKQKSRFTTIGLATVVGTGIGLIVLVFTTWMLLSSTFTQLNDAKDIIKQYQSNSIDYSAFVLKQDYDELQKLVLQLETYTERVSNANRMDKKNMVLNMNNTSAFLDNRLDVINKKIESLEEQIIK